ncbi:MAG: SPOR domain-containing protein [Azonexus sp.]|jgi:DedD protein|nr:SPOR domain-containing protein [Betaproteobacteria bacterium]MBK8916611.1 SPOR domain-containing protein [Betaproteobacteria bacterium]MBP6036952.1 SPOR domain-containing protein [Azonexus sp.]MBP6907432.1 SPOR domain-containing protein [Azonexus sp.]
MSEDTPESGELRGKLLKRLVVAGGLVAVLLAVLAFFDHLASAPEEPETPVYSQPVPVPPKKEMTQPVKGGEPTSEPKAAPAEPSPAPGAPAKPEVAAQPELPQPTAVPAAPAPKSAPVAQAPAAAPQSAVAVAPPAAVPEGTGAPTRADAPSRPAFPAPAASPAPMAVAPRAAQGYVLQAGVFSSPQRAEELHAKLTLAGIPSTLEARVQVGPFKSRQEADAAREKLRALGIDPVLIPPAGKH